MGREDVDWIHLAHDKRMVAESNKATNLWVISSPAERLLASQQGLCSVKLVRSVQKLLQT